MKIPPPMIPLTTGDILQYCGVPVDTMMIESARLELGTTLEELPRLHLVILPSTVGDDIVEQPHE